MSDIFLIKRNVLKDKGPDFDATHGFVIVAIDERQARDLAASYRKTVHDGRNRDEAPKVWHARTTTCIKIGIATKHILPGVILEDHQWG